MGKKDTIQRINLKEPLMNRIENYIQFISVFLMVKRKANFKNFYIYQQYLEFFPLDNLLGQRAVRLQS